MDTLFFIDLFEDNEDIERLVDSDEEFDFDEDYFQDYDENSIDSPLPLEKSDFEYYSEENLEHSQSSTENEELDVVIEDNELEFALELFSKFDDFNFHETEEQLLQPPSSPCVQKSNENKEKEVNKEESSKLIKRKREFAFSEDVDFLVGFWEPSKKKRKVG